MQKPQNVDNNLKALLETLKRRQTFKRFFERTPPPSKKRFQVFDVEKLARRK